MGTCTSCCLQQFKDLRLSETSVTMRDSIKKLDITSTIRANKVDHGTSSMSHSSVVEQIERSKAHWSTVVDHLGDTGEEEVDFEVSNEEEFKALQSHPVWGNFFANFSGDGKPTDLGYVYGELVVGKKFAEGAQAELHEAHIKWNDPETIEDDQRLEREYVLKVFKKGTLLRHVKCQLPEGLLRFHVEVGEYWMSSSRQPRRQYTSQIYRGILLKDGRFAFLMQKEHFDLRTLIERNMKLRDGEDCGPFSKNEAESLMFQVALGVEWLHNHDIVHRDLKASNVLVEEYQSCWPKWHCYVADYECSIGVVGTDYFMAPEILQACKDGKVKERPEVFSRAADVYSYGMTCYEILTGKLPFEDHPLRGRPSLLKDLVMHQHLRPEVPKYVEDWTRELLDGCWQFDPKARPSIEDILNVLCTNSKKVRRLKVNLKKAFGENFRL